MRSTLPVLTGARVRLRPAVLADAPRFLEILSEPEVAVWWPRFDRARVIDDIDGPDAEIEWAIELDGRVVGLIQAWEESDVDYRHAGIDLAISAAVRGRGLGPDAVRAVARWLFGERGHHRVTIDPAADNASAIRAYEKVGFRPVGVMRAYERGADGTFHDSLLMDMLRGELVEDVGGLEERGAAG